MIRKTTAVSVPALRWAIASALAASVFAPLASAQQAAATPGDEAELRQLSEQLAELKSAYAQEVRRLRELDMQVQALQSRLAGARSASLQVLQDVGVRFEQPAQAGMFLWGRLPDGVAVEPLVKDAWQQGILLAGSTTFGSEATSAGCLRFNVVYAQNVQLSRYLKERFALLEHTRHSLARIAQG